MSTFYGGPQLVSVTSLIRSSPGTSSYTVPAGHWAEVTFSTAYFASEFGDFSSSGIINGNTVCSSSVATPNNIATLNCVLAGTVISISTIGALGYAGIKVYKNP